MVMGKNRASDRGGPRVGRERDGLEPLSLARAPRTRPAPNELDLARGGRSDPVGGRGDGVARGLRDGPRVGLERDSLEPFPAPLHPLDARRARGRRRTNSISRAAAATAAATESLEAAATDRASVSSATVSSPSPPLSIHADPVHRSKTFDGRNSIARSDRRDRLGARRRGRAARPDPAPTTSRGVPEAFSTSRARS